MGRNSKSTFPLSGGRDRAPDYSSIWKRIGKTLPKFERNDMFDCVLGRTIRLVPDSTGVKLGNRDEWFSVKWKVARGFFKMHILVDLGTKRILAFSLTDMKGGDAAQLPDLLCRALGGTLEGAFPCRSQLPRWC